MDKLSDLCTTVVLENIKLLDLAQVNEPTAFKVVVVSP